jgi:hypothetical protein
MPDFTAGGIHALPKETRSIGNVEIDQRIHDLVRDWGCDPKAAGYVSEMIVTALKVGRDRLNEADMKLFNRALKELRHAAKVFGPYADRRKVVVFGSARTPEEAPEAQAAFAFGRKMREAGYMIITGGGDGIMGAAQAGAGREDSFGLNIRLPFEQKANEIIEGDPKLINFNYFFTRKLNFVKETHALALFPGGFGTLDEGFEVLTLMQTGKARLLPLVLVDKPGGGYWQAVLGFLRGHLLGSKLVSPEDFNLIYHAESVDDAVAHILQFYRTFVSYRWVGKKMVIRLNTPLTPAALAQLNDDFAGLLLSGRIEASRALPEEANQPELAALPRLVLSPQRHQFGQMRALIDAINEAERTAPS